MISTEYGGAVQDDERERGDLNRDRHEGQESDDQQDPHPSGDDGDGAHVHACGLGTGTESSARRTTVSADTPSNSASERMCTRWSMAGRTNCLMSSGIT